MMDATSSQGQQKDSSVGSYKSPEPRKVNTPSLTEVFTNRVGNPVSFVNSLVYEAVNLSASDIFFEPRRELIIIRARIDGVLYELGEVSHDSYSQISARIKVLSNLDPTQKREIQEGQFILDHEGKIVNLRVEIAQTVHGEVIVVRIHERETIIMKLSELGFSDMSYNQYQKMLKQRSGLVLACGPTGCGKTTTLYSTITALNVNQTYNVMTIEDPVEFRLEGVNQMQTNNDAEFTFAVGLSTILRMSPDIVLVGEIRDRETAQIAVESGLTGQLVLSTLHAEDAVGALFRLLDLDVETYLLNSSLVGVVAQRLVRRVCEFCHEPYEATKTEQDLFKQVMGRLPKQLTKGKGCEACKNLSYRGRAGIFEVLSMDSKLRDLIRDKVNEDVLRSTLEKTGFKTLLRDGFEKAELGITTIDEVLRNSLRFF